MTNTIVQPLKHRPPLGGYQPERFYVSEGEWVRGDPSPFALISFGMTLCMVMFVNAKWTEHELMPTVIFYALAFGGFGQLLAGLLNLIKGNTFGGTIFCSYGCFALGFGGLAYSNYMHGGAFVAPSASGRELFYGLWALLTLVFLISSLRKTGSIQAVLSSLFITLILMAAGVQNDNCNQAAGYFGVFCAGSALYAASIVLIKIELGYILPGIAPTLYFKHPLDDAALVSEHDKAEQMEMGFQKREDDDDNTPEKP